MLELPNPDSITTENTFFKPWSLHQIREQSYNRYCKGEQHMGTYLTYEKLDLVLGYLNANKHERINYYQQKQAVIYSYNRCIHEKAFNNQIN